MADRVLRVAIDGPDAAGKTTLADALAARIAEETGGARETSGARETGGTSKTIRVSIHGMSGTGVGPCRRRVISRTRSTTTPWTAWSSSRSRPGEPLVPAWVVLAPD